MFGRTLVTVIGVVAIALTANIPVLGAAETPAANPVGVQETTGTATSAEAPMRTDVASGGGSALRVEDPVTGEIAPLAPTMQESISTSDEGLVEVPDAGGGTMIRLQGRFRSYMKVSRDASGQISAVCSDEEAH
jgi:hypothetical protein